MSRWIFSGGWPLRQCNRREKLNRKFRLGYLVVGLALRPCDTRENLDRNLGFDI